MSSTSRLLSLPMMLVLSSAVSPGQSPEPVATAQPDTVVSEPQRDVHEDQATTRSVSQVRIVRLSQVRGEVQTGHSAEQKFEAAFPNLPIVSGEHLRTQEGVAEVEFEDNSSLRLVMDSQVNFVVLGRDAAGLPKTTVDLVRGGIYVSLTSSKVGGEFAIRAGHETITLAPSSHMRLDTTGTTAKLTVFQGTITATSDNGSIVVGKRKAITFDLNSSSAPVFAKLDEASPFDDWDKNAVEYHKSLAVASTYANSPYSYGVNDLAYYGSFSNVGGCGTMWRPYLATAAFDPYASGAWAWYPSSGYSWVSPYPWGWTPFHSGSWNYCGAGGGWGWQPEGGWNGLQNYTAAAPTAQKLRFPVRTLPHPPAPPRVGQPRLVGVNLGGLQASKAGTGDSFVFQGGSAGLGVPRGVFGNLGKMSQHASGRGFATTSISETQATRGLLVTSRMVASANSMQGGTGVGNRTFGNSSAGNRSSSSSTHAPIHTSSDSSSARSAGSSSPSFSSGASAAHGSGSSPAGGSSHH